MQHRIAVVGQGVIGLTSVHRLLARGHRVTVFSRDPFSDTTSMAAGAYWWPHKIAPEERVAGWARETYEEYVASRENPEAGILFESHYRFCIDPDSNAYVRFLLDDWEAIDGAAHGVPCAEAFRMTLPVIDVPVFMNTLRRQAEARGVHFIQRELAEPNDLFPEFDLVVNCTGVGARQFVGDNSVFPIRGQSVRVSKPPGLRASTRLYRQEDQFALVLPRSNDVILGGNGRDGDWDRRPRDHETTAIVARCSQLVPKIAEAEVLEAKVGLRPGRPEVRLELERMAPGCPVIHNYGHGGAGFTVGWGCANEVGKLADHALGT